MHCSILFKWVFLNKEKRRQVIYSLWFAVI